LDRFESSPMTVTNGQTSAKNYWKVSIALMDNFCSLFICGKICVSVFIMPSL
jgi:hypothetical protein